VTKDRAAPFSRKHRRYWIPVTGGMILIGVVNVAIGLCSYKEAPEPEPMEVQLAPPDAAGTLAPHDLPVPVMRAFNTKYPRTLPTAARVDGDTYTVMFGAGKSATFRGDGAFVSEH
jgi:hypothetical protein